MGFDLEGPSISPDNQIASPINSAVPPRIPRTKSSQPSAQDKIESNPLHRPSPSPVFIPGFPLLNPKGAAQCVDQSYPHFAGILEQYPLPKTKDLFSRLPPTFHQRLQSMSDDYDFSFELKCRHFLDSMAKLHPLSLALLEGILQTKETLDPSTLSDRVLNLLKEIGSLLHSHLESLSLPAPLKSALISLAEQMANLTVFSTSDPKQLQEALLDFLNQPQNNDGSPPPSDVADALSAAANSNDSLLSSSSPLYRQLQELGLLQGLSPSLDPLDLKSILSQLQSGLPISGKSGHALFHSLSSLLEVIGLLQHLSPASAQTTFSLHIAMQGIGSQTNPAGLLGASIEEFIGGISAFLGGIKNTSEGPPDPKGDLGRLYSQAFTPLILSGSILGRLLAGHPNSRESLEESIPAALMKFEAAKELGLFDQIPFSFLAFLPDLRGGNENPSNAVRAAKSSLIELIRILLKLIFVLAAIVSAGKTLGGKGMERMLEENSLFITGLLDQLIFALKKLDENYVVNVNNQIALAQRAKEALITLSANISNQEACEGIAPPRSAEEKLETHNLAADEKLSVKEKTTHDAQEFWIAIFHMFSPKTELAGFLKNMEDANPLFTVIEGMLADSQQTLPYFHEEHM